MARKKQLRQAEVEEVVEYVEEDTECDSDEYEIVYKEVEVTDSEENSEEDDGLNGSDNGVEYEYVTEIVEVEEEADLQVKRLMELQEQYAELEKINKRFSASLRHLNTSSRSLSRTDSSSSRKSVSFSSVHSVLTEDDEVIFVDEADDIFK